MKTLLVMRHAKSDWEAEYATDHDRPLNQRGVRSAQLMGRLLAARRLAPQAVITSTAVRAHRTAELAREAGRWDANLFLEPNFYGTSSREVIAAITKAPNVDRLMVVGHQPTWSVVVDDLTDRYVDMKTAAVAVIALPITVWADTAPMVGSLVEVLYPREFFGSEWDR